MHCVKLLGQPLMARDFDRQVAEFQVRIAILNGYTALGIPVTETVDKSVRGKGKLGCQPICATAVRGAREHCRMFAAVHASFFNHFNQDRSLYSRANFKRNRAAALTEWHSLCAE